MIPSLPVSSLGALLTSLIALEAISVPPTPPPDIREEKEKPGYRNSNVICSSLAHTFANLSSSRA